MVEKFLKDWSIAENVRRLNAECWRLSASIHRTRAWPARIAATAASARRRRETLLRFRNGKGRKLLIEIPACTPWTFGWLRSPHDRLETAIAFLTDILEDRHVREQGTGNSYRGTAKSVRARSSGVSVSPVTCPCTLYP